MITINGKEYRNLQEQVQKNMDDINNLQENVQTNAEDINELKNRPIGYSKEESLNIFQTKIGMGLYATKQELTLQMDAEVARVNLALGTKQDTLVSGTNIKTINGQPILGQGNIAIGGAGTAGYGISINNDVISIDQNIVATTNILNGYIKDNDLNYSAIFRGKAVYVKTEGVYTSTSYGDGSIGRTIPNQPGYSYTLPDKSGTFALLDDIPSTSNLVSKDVNGNVNGILQVAHLQSENWDEDDDCKADITLGSGLRSSSISLETSGEESGSRIFLRGSSATESEGYIDLYGETRINTSNRIKVYDPDVQGSEETIAYLSDIPASGSTVSGTNDGTNWTSLTVDGSTYNIPSMPTPTTINLYAHKISFNITFSGSNNITGIATIISTSSAQITTSTALSNAVRDRGVVPASGKYTGSSSANNGRVIELTYGQGSYSQLCAVVVYDYEDIIDVVSIAANTITDTVTQI